MIVLWTAVAGLSGSLMFSYWLGLAAKKNLQTIGDGNPGGYNLWRAAGFKFGLAGIVLDFMKGYLPLIIFLHLGYLNGYQIVPVAIAPIVGHAFSPFLKGRGGKAIAVTFGVWSALTGFEISLVYALILALLQIIARAIGKGKPVSSEANGLQVVFAMLLIVAYLFERVYSAPVIWFWFGNFLLLVYTHKKELAAWFKRILPE